MPRGLFRDAARAQIEQRVVVQVAGGRAVAAFHVVGIDLQLRLGVDLRLVGQQQCLAELMAVRLLRVLVDHDPPLEDGARGIIDHALEDLAARGPRLQVFDHGGRVAVLRVAQQVGAVQVTFGAFAVEAHRGLVARQPATGGLREAVVHRVAPEAGVQRGDMNRLGAFLLDLVVVQLRAIPERDLGRAVGKVRTRAEPDVVLDHGGVAIRLEHDQVARMEGDGLRPGRAHVNHLDGQRDGNAALDPEHQPVAHHRGVEREQGLAVELANLSKVGGDAVRIAGQRLGQAAELDALGQLARHGDALAQAAVDEDHAVADAALRKQRGQAVDADRGRGPRGLEAGLLQEAEAGVFPRLLARAGQAERGKALDPGAAQIT